MRPAQEIVATLGLDPLLEKEQARRSAAATAIARRPDRSSEPSSESFVEFPVEHSSKRSPTTSPPRWSVHHAGGWEGAEAPRAGAVAGFSNRWAIGNGEGEEGKGQAISCNHIMHGRSLEGHIIPGKGWRSVLSICLP